VSTEKATAPNATVNLLNLMVKRGLIKEEDAKALIKQAEDEAYVTHQAAKDATAKADDAAKAATAAAAAATPAGAKHVTYVPEIVKRQLREEIKQEVMTKAERENWASPGKYPEWASRIHFYGDLRMRYQGNFFPAGNDQVDAWNWNAINTGSPYDIGLNNPFNAPTYNVTQDRNQVRFRARLGLDADLFDGFTAGLRIATGENSSPVSTNQTFGNNGGDFSKYALWIDRPGVVPRPRLRRHRSAGQARGAAGPDAVRRRRRVSDLQHRFQRRPQPEHRRHDQGHKSRQVAVWRAGGSGRPLRSGVGVPCRGRVL
jgi:hypothetical protein